MKFKKNSIYIGLGLSIAFAMGTFLLSLRFFATSRMSVATMYNAGIDVMGAFVCAVLFYGCMRQVDYASRSFTALVIMVGATFLLNELMWYVDGVPAYRNIYIYSCLAIKTITLLMIYFFYLYVRRTLDFKGRLVTFADKFLPAVLIFSLLVVWANYFYPTTFMINTSGAYENGKWPILENVFLASAAVITTILIFRSGATRRQRWAAMSFILIPIAQYVASGAPFNYATQYGAVLLSLILMYCILFNDRSSKLAATQAELDMATQIQVSMLPSIFPAFPTREEFDIYASMNPAKEVGGDFYDFFLVDDDHLALIIADVSGKGIPAALFMMISKAIIQNLTKLKIGAAEILAQANETLSSDNRMEMFVTTWIGILDIPSGKMSCANAGHEYPAICRGGRYELLKDKHGLVLGGLPGLKYKEYEIQLEKGDKIFLYTDGVPEATRSDESMFGTDRMLETLNASPDANPKEVLSNMQRAVDTFVAGAEQFDDLTMLCLEYMGK